MFNLFDPPTGEELSRAVARGMAFVERDTAFRDAILNHPDFTGVAGGHGASTPHVLPDSFGAALFDLGRFFGQALYYRFLKRPLTPKQMVGVSVFTNAAPLEHRDLVRAFGSGLRWFVPEPAKKTHEPLFGFGATYSDEKDALYFSAERRGAFVWLGVAGALDPRLLGLEDMHAWYGDGTRFVSEGTP